MKLKRTRVIITSQFHSNTRSDLTPDTNVIKKMVILKIKFPTFTTINNFGIYLSSVIMQVLNSNTGMLKIWYYLNNHSNHARRQRQA